MHHGWGQKLKHFFSERSRVVYQIKGNEALSTTQAYILSLHTFSASGVE